MAATDGEESERDSWSRLSEHVETPASAVAHALVKRANAAFAGGDFGEAHALWTELLAIVPAAYHFAIHTNRGAALERLGRPAEAIAAYDVALVGHPGHVEALHNRGVALKAVGRLDEALASFDAALAVRPAFYASLRGRADLLTHLGRYAEAADAASAAVALRPGDPAPLTDRAFARLKARQLDAAIADYRAAVTQLGDTSPETARLFAVALSQRAVELDREAAAAAAAAGAGGSRGGSGAVSAEAEALYDEAIAIEATESRLFNRALLHMRAGRRDDAAAGFARVAALAPGNAAARGALGTLLLELGRPAEAVPHLEDAHALRPRAADVAFNLGFARLKTRDFARAAAAFEAAAEIDPGMEAAVTALAAARAAALAAPASDGADGSGGLDVGGAVNAPHHDDTSAGTGSQDSTAAGGGGRKGSVSERFRGAVAMPAASWEAQHHPPSDAAPPTRGRALSLVRADKCGGAGDSEAAGYQPLYSPSVLGQLRGGAGAHPHAHHAATDAGGAARRGSLDASYSDAASGAADTGGSQSPSRHFCAQPPDTDLDGYRGVVLPFCELVAPGPYPPHIDVGHREAYLCCSEFEAVLGVAKRDFYRWPKWRRVQRKKECHLF